MNDRECLVLSALQYAADLPPAGVQELVWQWLEHWHPKETRLKYPSTGWCLREMEGTQWINVHSRTVGTVYLVKERFGVDRRLTLEYKPNFDIGVWVEDYYCIDNYLRFDVLSVDQQLAWLLTLRDHPLLPAFCEQHNIFLTPEQLNAWRSPDSVVPVQLQLF